MYKWMMDKAYRFYSIFFSVVFAFTSITGCFQSPIRGHAVIIDWIDEIEEYVEQYERNLWTVKDAVVTDMQNGNFDASTDVGKQILQNLAWQTAMGAWATGFYEQVELEDTWNDLPPSYTVNIGGISNGFYRVSGESELRYAYAIPFSEPGQSFVFGDDFELSYTYGPYSGYSGPVKLEPLFDTQTVGANIKEPYRVWSSGYDSKGFFNSRTYDFVVGSSGVPVGARIISGIPTLYRGDTVSGYGTFAFFGGGVDVTINEFTIDPTKPWEYYNNEYLPFARSTFPLVEDKYYVFPQGYNPNTNPNPTDPPEPPSTAITDPVWDGVAQPETEVVPVTDENGEPVTDENGETETETVYVTDTTPNDLNWNFDVPTLPQLPMPEIPELNAEIPEAHVSSIGAAFDYMTQILEASGLMYILPFVLSILACFWLIHKAGG